MYVLFLSVCKHAQVVNEIRCSWMADFFKPRNQLNLKNEKLK